MQMQVEVILAGEQLVHGSHSITASVVIHRHCYAGTKCEDQGPQGFVEVLEFPEPPEGKPTVIVHKKKGKARIAFRFDTVENALTAARSDRIWAIDQVEETEEPNIGQALWISVPGCFGLELFDKDNHAWFIHR
jgi:hypothetical protein